VTRRRFGTGLILYICPTVDLVHAFAFVIHIDDVVPRLRSLSSDVFIESING
jgi:hypothetical protein